MKHVRLKKKIRFFETAAQRRRLNPGEKAILRFARDYVTLQENNADAMRADEDEDESRLVCTAEDCGEVDHPDGAEYCHQCGAKLKSLDDEGEMRARTDEGRVVGKDDRNDLGFIGYRGQNTPKHSERVGADEAIKSFQSNYKRTRESGVVRDFVTGA